MRPVPLRGGEVRPLRGRPSKGTRERSPNFWQASRVHLQGTRGRTPNFWRAAFESPWTFESVQTKRSAAPGGFEGGRPDPPPVTIIRSP